MFVCKLFTLVFFALVSDGLPIPNEEDGNPDNRVYSAIEANLKQAASLLNHTYKDFHDPNPEDFGEYEDYLCFGGK